VFHTSASQAMEMRRHVPVWYAQSLKRQRQLHSEPELSWYELHEYRVHVERRESSGPHEGF